MKHFKFKSIKSNKKIRNKTNTFLFYLLCVLTLSLTVGYAAINSDVSVSREASFRTIEEIRISDVRMHEVTNGALESYSSNYNKDTVITGVDLPYTNSTITYKVEVTNYGSVAMKIDSITNESFNNNDMEYTTSGYTLNTFVSPGQTVELYITFKYKSTVANVPLNTTLDSSIKLTYQKPDSELAQGTSSGATTKFFNNGPINKNEVETIEFLPTLDVGSNALGYWDASKELNGTVIAWYTDTDSDNLYELYIGGIGTVQAPANSANLFSNFTNLTDITFNGYLNTENSTTMASMFNGCSSLEELDLSSWKTPSLITITGGGDTSSTFYRCTKLRKLDMRNFDTSNVTNMAFLFAGLSSLEDLNISGFNVEKVTNMSAMFWECSKLTELDLSSWETPALTTLYANWGNTGMFSGCTSLVNLDISNFDTSNVTNMSYLFFNCSKLASLDLSNFNTSKVTTISYMFNRCSSLEELDLSSWKTPSLITITGGGDTSSTFYRCTKLRKLDMRNFDTSNVTNMAFLFAGLSSLEDLNISGFNVEKVTNMSAMFWECSKLTELDLSSWETPALTTLYANWGNTGMFSGCTSLVNLDISNFDTSNVTNMSYLFFNCSKLASLDIRNFSFTNVTNYSNIFYSIPANSIIIVNGQTEKNWILDKRSELNNIKLVSEL